MENRISKLQKHLEWLEMQPVTPHNVQDMRATRVELNCWNEKKDAMWLQQSRINWYQAGDQNTGFFHAKASARKLKDHIEGLLDENDCWQEDEEKIGELVVNYYEKLFSTNHPTEFTELLQALQPKVTVEMNKMLGKDFTIFKV